MLQYLPRVHLADETSSASEAVCGPLWRQENWELTRARGHDWPRAILRLVHTWSDGVRLGAFRVLGFRVQGVAVGFHWFRSQGF